MQQFRPAGNCILEKGKPVARPGRKAMGPELSGSPSYRRDDGRSKPPCGTSERILLGVSSARPMSVIKV